jgi:hypothetical protein
MAVMDDGPGLPWLPEVQQTLPGIRATSSDPVAFIARLHRKIDDPEAGVGLVYISPQSKEGEQKRPKDLSPIIPHGTASLGELTDPKDKLELRQHLKGPDVYMTVNTVWRPPDCSRWKKSRTTGLPITKRTERELRFLNCAYCDIDAYKANLTPQQAYDNALQCLQKMRLPLPTVSLWSGKGIWLLWEFTEPVPARQRERSALRRINQNICERLAFLEADPKCVDPARICRIPGSINSKNGETVRWETIPGGVPTSLTDLFVAFDCQPIPTSVSLEEKKPEDERDESRRLRACQRWLVKCRDISRYVDYQNQPQGLRYTTIFWYAALAKRGRLKVEQIMPEATRIGKGCRTPPMTDEEIETAVRKGMSKKLRLLICDSTIARELKIPEDAGRALLGLTLFTKKLRKPLWQKTRHTRREAIRQNIMGLIDEAGKIIPTRKMADLLRTRGFSLSHVSISKHYSALTLRLKNPVNKSPCVSLDFKHLDGEQLTRTPMKTIGQKKKARGTKAGRGINPGLGVS